MTHALAFCAALAPSAADDPSSTSELPSCASARRFTRHRPSVASTSSSHLVRWRAARACPTARTAECSWAIMSAGTANIPHSSELWGARKVISLWALGRIGRGVTLRGGRCPGVVVVSLRGVSRLSGGVVSSVTSLGSSEISAGARRSSTLIFVESAFSQPPAREDFVLDRKRGSGTAIRLFPGLVRPGSMRLSSNFPGSAKKESSKSCTQTTDKAR